MSVCNHDCENCKYDDCICDEPLTEDEMKQSLEREKLTGNRKKTYYQEHREHCIQKAKEFHAKHPERQSKYWKKYYYSHRQKCIDRAMRWQKENKKEIKDRNLLKRVQNEKDGSYFREQRRKRGLTQMQLAKILGFSVSSICKFELGERKYDAAALDAALSKYDKEADGK